VTFKVPTAEELGAVVPGAGETKAELVTTPAAHLPKAPATKEPQIEFLCPNGHRLHGPASMQGRPGQCPECGSKFSIPSYSDDLTEEEEFEREITSDEAEEPAESESREEESSVAVDEGYSLEGDGSPQHSPAQGVAQAEALPQSWGELFTALWSHKSDGVVIEVCLKDREMIVPDRFTALPGGQQAIFAVKTKNGLYTLTAVAWESVTRVVVRGLKALPLDVFGE
jgi:hypothetical protein